MEQRFSGKIRQKTYLRIVDVVMDMIARGEVQYGDRFYNEQELVTMLGISRPTLREALRVLEFLGVATVVPHKGISINRPSQSGGYLPLLYILMFEKTTGKELFQLRQAMQLEMAALAAQTRTEEDIKALRALVLQMEQQKKAAPETFSQLDDAFHRKLMEISGNRLVCKLMDTIHPMLQNQLTSHIRNLSKHRDQTIAEHTRIVDCLEKGDSSAAHHAMYDHLTASRRDAGNEPVSFSK